MNEYRKMAVKTAKLSFRLPAAAAMSVLVVTGSNFSPIAITDAKAEGQSGRQVYQTSCALCHKSGLNAAPKYGDKRAWEPRLSKGKEAMYTSAIDGKGSMPPRGGNTKLTDEEVKAAVDYIAGSVGGWPGE